MLEIVDVPISICSSSICIAPDLWTLEASSRTKTLSVALIPSASLRAVLKLLVASKPVNPPTED